MRHIEQTLHIDLQDACMLGQVDILKIAAVQNTGTIEQQAQLPVVQAAEAVHCALDCLRVSYIQRGMPDVVQLGGELGGRTVLELVGVKLECEAGRAGGTADAFTLFERLEAKLERHPGQLMRAAVELAKDWRSDRYLRRLEAMMIVADTTVTLVITGNGDVLEPEKGIIAIGSGGNYALAAARALADGDLDAESIARKAMAIAAEICVYTNNNLTIETLATA